MAALLLFLLLLTLSFPTSFSQIHLCEGTNSTTTATFLSNLNLLLDSFPSTNATFSNQSYGSGHSKIYGLALCLGDVGLSACRTCLSSAAQYITQSCPNNTEASVWLDNCQLRYSGTLFFNSVDTRGEILLNVANATEVDKFSQLEKELLEKLADAAAYNSRIMYATGRAEGRGLPDIYGLAQCTRDLSAENCSTCLTRIIAEFSQSYPARVGGRFLANSCLFRYEVYHFFAGKPSVLLPLPTPPTLPPSSSALPPEAMPPAVRSHGQGSSSGSYIPIALMFQLALPLGTFLLSSFCPAY